VTEDVHLILFLLLIVFIFRSATDQSAFSFVVKFVKILHLKFNSKPIFWVSCSGFDIFTINVKSRLMPDTHHECSCRSRSEDLILFSEQLACI